MLCFYFYHNFPLLGDDMYRLGLPVVWMSLYMSSTIYIFVCFLQLLGEKGVLASSCQNLRHHHLQELVMPQAQSPHRAAEPEINNKPRECVTERIRFCGKPVPLIGTWAEQ